MANKDSERAAYRKDVARSREAQELKSNTLLEQLMERIESRSIQQWKDTAPDAVEERERHYFRVQAISEVRQEIQSAIEAGDLAEIRLEKLDK